MRALSSRPRGRALLPAVLALLLTAVASGCAAEGEQRSGIVVTTNILGDITRNIVGDQAEVTVLMKPGADPHSFGISAQEAALLENAELVIHNGLGLEEGVHRNVEAADQAGVPTLAVGEAVDPIDYTEGETQGQADPHFWTDPVRVRQAVDLIAAQVSEQVDGVDTERIQANAEEYGGQIDELHEENTRAFAEIPEERRRLVTNHHVFGYLAQRYDFEVIGAVIPSGTTLASPSASDLESLSSAVEQAGVPAVFADSSQPDRLARVMAEEAGLDIEVIPLFSESLTAEGEGAATYVEMTRANTDAIVRGLTRE
ncbi:zinc ABC transporter substrate-binding protein AztC [Marinactinospora thermotolerans]|uniref:Zinc/manganese transport system substrate-binding protein n=1 Tax=Marinactinospora thermotolerans DSM 45154 TaxID=1122192 RepID=A0A1T4NGE7_9ACTN|nr:zinc ABC transporter substrate-binding protein AztC [Marinactinospora thermotolerans]SJZ78294.1 zinc/manganese transport system substrate-binding protein [Marinactinospora thermotolerans DSM 45154]